MAKKKKTTSKTTAKAADKKASGDGKAAAGGPNASGKHLVIVESPTKAKTINKYLGKDYVVMASVGHVRDLPPRNPKGVNNPVPGVDLENDFEPTYEVMKDSQKTIAGLRKAAKQADDVWFATDLDREGEAIAWHLVHALSYPEANAKRVVFNAITKAEIEHAFANPREIDINKVDAQQARRILDRIVGYQVSQLLWKKVASKLSAGRVQSVATRLVVEREREIEAFIPDEYWKIAGVFSVDPRKAASLGEQWRKWINTGDDQNPRTIKDQVEWLSEHEAIKAELFELADKPFKPDNRDAALAVAKALGFDVTDTRTWTDDKAKGPQRERCEYLGTPGSNTPDYVIESIETKRNRNRPSPPFITSTLQQQASTRLGFNLKRTMRVAQQLYEGVDLGGVYGQTGLITYMRTDSTHLSGEALNAVRHFINTKHGDAYLPEKPNFYTSSNKDAQEAHEAIRPTDVNLTPQQVRSKLSDEQFRLYDLIWRRFVASQMTPAETDSTTITIAADTSAGKARFKANGRRIVFDGYYKVMGAPGSDVILPELKQDDKVGLVHLDPTQNFTSPPPRYTEASLQKKLEEEGIGRPSTYASIIGTIQDRKYVQPLNQRDKRLFATDLGKVVTDKLVEGFPRIMDVGYTRDMETELDKIEEDHHDWRQMLRDFYGPFKENLERAHETMEHAKAVTEPAPYKCAECGAPTVYRFGKSGRFLSCSRYPDCKYSAPIDREGKPQPPLQTDILCPDCGGAMTKRNGRFGPFLGCVNYPECKGILKLDPKKGHVVLPKAPPLTSDVPCPKCEAPLYVRDSKRGLWLSCSKFPKCRGRVGFNTLDEKKQKELEKLWAEHLKQHPIPAVRTDTGRVIEEGEEYHPVIADEETLTTGSDTPGGGGGYDESADAA